MTLQYQLQYQISTITASTTLPLQVNRFNVFFNFLSGPGRFSQFEYADHEYHRQKCPRSVCLDYVGFKVCISRVPIGTVSTLNSRVTRIYKFIYHALTFIVGAHSNLYARNINLYNTGI